MVILRHTHLQPRQVPHLKERLRQSAFQAVKDSKAEKTAHPAPPTAERLVDGLLTITALGLASSLLASPAFAWGQTWRPRRHHRRLGEWERTPDLGKYTIVCFSKQQAHMRRDWNAATGHF